MSATIESPVELAARKHRLTITSQTDERIEGLLMRIGTGNYSWAVHNYLDAVRRALEPNRAWCPFYREFLDNLPEDA